MAQAGNDMIGGGLLLAVALGASQRATSKQGTRWPTETERPFIKTMAMNITPYIKR
jgi:hypothetical protein